MGKLYQTQQQLQEQIQAQNQAQASSSSSDQSHLFCVGGCSNGLARIRKALSVKCVLVLIVSVALFLSAIFWLPPFNRLTSGCDANDSDTHQLNVTVKASFRLQKSASLIVAHKETLENDILEEIGLPNTKVSVLSMHEDTTSNWTDVVFGVLPDPNDVPINLVSLSVLRSSLVELFLGRLNLSLTTSIFGKPSSFEILKCEGGINVVPVPSAFVTKIPQILFNFTLNNSISQIELSFYQFKEQLKLGLYLMPYENVYVQLRNGNGSTVDPPVTVQASVTSEIGSHYLLPQRLKQLAQIITKSPPAKNLGLDHSVFGKVKGISLSSILNRTLRTSPGSPSPSPSPSPSASPSRPPSPADAPLVSPLPAPIYPPTPSSDHHDRSPCSHCGASFPFAPIPAYGPQQPSPLSPESPAPSQIATPRQSPCHDFTVSPSPVPISQFNPSSSPQPTTSSAPAPSLLLPPDIPPSPSVSQGISPDHGRRRGKTSVLPAHASSPLSPSPSSSASDPCYRETWLLGMLLSWLFHLLCEPYL